jgi:hypothetical protein
LGGESVVYGVWTRIFIVDRGEEEVPSPPARDRQCGAEEWNPCFVVELENPGPEIRILYSRAKEEGKGKGKLTIT